MNSLSDQQLLRAYTERRSEAAFAELVRRHLDLVYSAGPTNPAIAVRNASVGGTVLLSIPAPGNPSTTSIEFFRFNAGAWSRVLWPPKPDPLDPLTATAGQFENGTVLSGWQTTRITSGAGGTGITPTGALSSTLAK